jgi:hypothetical protein
MVTLVMNDKDLAATLARNGMEVSTLFSWNRIAEHHVTMYNMILQRGDNCPLYCEPSNTIENMA